MTRSNVQAANMRRTNRRIQFQEKAIRETQARVYRQAARRIAAEKVTIWSGMKVVARDIVKYLSNFFSGHSSLYGAINALDFTIDKGDRGAGARQLRDIFGQGLKMRSTRDGRPV